jgi:deoxyadenosine/deoxycytidine kinase
MKTKQRIIAIVGPDQCGKTQIAKELSRVLDIPYFKASSEHDTYLRQKDKFIHQLKYADTRVVDFLKQTGYSAIFDRAWPCEFVYSKVMNRETDVSVLAYVDKQFAALGAKVVVCYRESYDGIIDDIDEHITSMVLLRLERMYREFAGWTSCQTVFLSVDDENLEREVTDVITWLDDV